MVDLIVNHFKRLYPLFLPLAIFISFIFTLKFISSKVVFQITGSMPQGIYLIKPAENINANQFIIFDLPENVKQTIRNRRWVPDRVSMLMKVAIGLPGDNISLNEKGVYVNGVYFGPVKQHDKQGLPLPVINSKFTLQKDQYFAACRSVNSFDSRYFGPVPKSEIKGVVEPFLIFK